MDTKDIRAFMALYEEKSISSAAKRLYITPQGLSLVLKKIESEMEGSLFDRTNKGITPTDLAHSFYRHSQSLMRELHAIKTKTQTSASEGCYPLYIASTLGVMDYLTIRFIKEMRTSYPLIHITVIENPDRSVKERLLNNEAEIGILAGPIDTTVFHAIPFTRHHHCLVIHETHPLAKKFKISYSDLDGQPLALEGRDFMPFHNNMNRFLKAGVTPDIIRETTEIVSTHEIASRNEGIGLSVDFPAWTARLPHTVIRPFEDMDCTWETYIVYPKHTSISEEARQFISAMQEWLKLHKHELFFWPEPYGEYNKWYKN